MVKIERSSIAPASLALQKSYREADVIERLERDFYGKCYICELKELADINVEHLEPHKNGKIIERKFDWNNLFLSCVHCNSVKNKREYDDMILDCCRVDPEKKINFDFENSNVKITTKDEDDNKAIKTAELITEVFNIKNTGIRERGSDFRLKKLQKEMIVLFENLKKCKENKISLNIIRANLRRESTFAAFKRFYVRKNIEKYPELREYIEE